MPTTKIRKKTPMKNRPVMWRRMAKKIKTDNGDIVRTGRKLKNAMLGTNHPGFLLPIHIELFKKAGISTPVFDKQHFISNNINNEIQGDENVVI